MPSSAALLFCLITAVSDGDSLTADCSDHRQPSRLAVRVADIDAPERGQPYGGRARQHLRSLCMGRTAAIRPVAIDAYGRTVARVNCDDRDVGPAQLSAGLAWAYRPQGADDPMLVLQQRARDARLGLWAAPRPTPPWQWRARERKQEREGEGQAGP